MREEILRISRRLKEETDSIEIAMKQIKNAKNKIEKLNTEVLCLLNKLEVTE